MIFCANTTANVESNDVDNVIDKLADKVNEVNVDSEIDENEDIVDVRDYIGLDLRQHISEEQNSELSFSSTKMARSRIEKYWKTYWIKHTRTTLWIITNLIFQIKSWLTTSFGLTITQGSSKASSQATY